MTREIDAAHEECPRWYVKVRFPASLDDPRGIFEIPAPLLATGPSAETVEVPVAPHDKGVDALLDVVSAASKSESAGMLNVTLRDGFLAAVTAFLAGASLECNVETQPFAALN